MQRLRDENYTEEEFYELLGREKERLAGKRSQKRSEKSRPKKTARKALSSKKSAADETPLDTDLENLDDLFLEEPKSSKEEQQDNFNS